MMPSMIMVVIHSVTRLGDFLKFLATKMFFSKVAQKLGDILGYFEKNFLIKHCCGSFLGNVWGKFCYFLILLLVTLWPIW